MTALYINPVNQPLSNIGTILPAATLTFYETGTTTLAPIYDDAGGTLPNPITADAYGRFSGIYLDSDTIYRVVLKTLLGVVVADIDPYSPDTSVNELTANLAAPTGATLIGTPNGDLQDVLYALKPAQPVEPYSPIASGYARAIVDFRRNFLDPFGDTADNNLERIRPTDGSGGINTGLTTKDTPRDGSYWQMCQGLNLLYNDWKATGSETSRSQIEAQWIYLAGPKTNRSAGVYTIAELGSDGSTDGTINSLDDAGWKCRSLVQMYEATGDYYAIRALRSAIPAALRRFADPFSTPVVLGAVYDEQSGTTKNFQYSIYGCQYDTGTDGGHGTASFEQQIAIAALYIAQSADSNDLYATYAMAYAATQKQYFKHVSGNYISTIGLDPSNTATYLQDVGGYFGYPKEGVTNLAFGATISIAVLNARLFHYTGTAAYLTEAQSIATAMVKMQGPSSDKATWGFVSNTTVTQDVFLAWTDPWTDGFDLPTFAMEVLTLPGVDTTNAWKTIAKATGLSIIAQRTTLPYPPTPSTMVIGCYPSDWGGNLLTASTAGLISGYISYQARYNATRAVYDGGGSQTSPIWEAGAQQIMTSATTLAMLLAACVIDQWGANALPSPVSSGYDASGALVTVGAETQTLSEWLVPTASEALLDPRVDGAIMDGATDDTVALGKLVARVAAFGTSPVVVDFGGRTMLAGPVAGGIVGFSVGAGTNVTLRNGKLLVKGANVTEYPFAAVYGEGFSSFTLEDFEIDYQNPPFFQAKCVAISGADIQLDWAGYWSPSFNDALSIYQRDPVTHDPIAVVTFGPSTGAFTIDTRAGTTLWVRSLSAIITAPQVGDLYTVSHRNFDADAIIMEGGSDLTLIDCKIRAAAGAGLFARYVDRVRVFNHDESPASGSGRWQTTNVDALHFDMCSDRIDVSESTFGWCGDDALNIVSREYQATSISGSTFNIVTPGGSTIESGLIVTSPGDQVAFTDANGIGQGIGTITAQVGGGATTRTITVDTLPGGIDSTWRVNLLRYAPEVRVLDNRIGHNRGRGIVGLGRNVELRDNKIIGSFGTGIEAGVSPYQTDFAEGELQAKNIIVSGNTVERCAVDRATNRAAIIVAAYKPDGTYAGYGAGAGVEIEDNTIRQAPNSGILVAGFTGITVKGNSFADVATNPATFTPNTTPVALALMNCDKLRLGGNSAISGVSTIATFGTMGTDVIWGDNTGMDFPGVQASRVWGGSSPALSAGTGAFTSASVTMRTEKVGRTLMCSVEIDITTAGSASGSIMVAMPYAAATTGYLHGREATVTGAAVTGEWQGSVLTILKDDNTSIIGDGRTIRLSGLGETV